MFLRELFDVGKESPLRIRKKISSESSHKAGKSICFPASLDSLIICIIIEQSTQNGLSRVSDALVPLNIS